MGRSRQTAPYAVPQCMVFKPSLEEIRNFQGYMEYMEEKGAHRAGIAKIVLPEGWTPRKSGYALESIKDLVIKRPIKQNFTNVGEDKRAYQTKSSSRGPMTVQEYYELSQSHTYRTPPHKSYDDLERKYWKSLSFVPPIYGADITDSITDPDCVMFNIAKLQSILNYVNEDQNESYAGVTTPYLYMGSWKTTFSWHVEDMDLYAINYLHFGEPKSWYCVPPKYGHLLEKACRSLFPNVANWCSNFMRHKTCLINPSLLDELGVPYQKVVQEERNAIIVYPYAYHSGFNHGFNCAESTNFALERWVEYGKRYRPCDCSSNNVKINMDCFVKRFQPEIYQKWAAGKDIGPHPEDPPDVVALIRMKVENPEAYASLMAEKIQKEAEKSSEKLLFYTSTGRSLAVLKNTLEFIKGATLSPLEKKEFELWKQEQRNNSKIIFREAGGPIVSADRRLVHVYQHVELTQLRIKVLPRTLTVVGDGLFLLKQSLPNERFQSVKELIDRGALLKIGERQMRRKRNFVKGEKAETAETSSSKVSEKVVWELMHTYMDLKALVFADNPNKFYGRQTDALTTFMENSDMTAMIQNGVFKKTGEMKVMVEEEPETEKKETTAAAAKSSSSKAAAALSKAPADDSEFEFFNIYLNNETGNYIAVNPLTLATPNVQQEALDLGPGQNMYEAKKYKAIQANKKFRKGIEYKCVTTPVKVYHFPRLDIDFYMTKETPSRLHHLGRPRRELVDFLNAHEFSELEANGSIVYKEDISACRYKGIIEVGGGGSRDRRRPEPEVEAQMSVKKYYFSTNSLVEVEVVRRLDKVLYRLPMGDGKEVFLQLLIKHELEDLTRRGGLLVEVIPATLPPADELARLEQIVKCDVVPKKLYKFSVRDYPKRSVWTNAAQTDIVKKMPEELRSKERSSVELLKMQGTLYNGVEQFCYMGQTLLKKAIMKGKIMGEVGSGDYEVSHPSLEVTVSKNHREREIFLLKKEAPSSSPPTPPPPTAIPSTVIPEEEEEKTEDPAVPEEPMPSSMEAEEDFIIREDEEVDEEDFDDIEDSEEEELVLPEAEDPSDDDKGRAQSDEEAYSPNDPDYRINQPYKYRPSPCLKRRKRKAGAPKGPRGRPRGKKGKKGANEGANESEAAVLESANVIHKDGEDSSSVTEEMERDQEQEKQLPSAQDDIKTDEL